MTGTLSQPSPRPAATSLSSGLQSGQAQPGLGGPGLGQPGADPYGPKRPRPVGARTADDRLALAGSLAGSLGLVFVTYDRLLPFSGPVGFFVCWYLVFMLCYLAVSAMAHPRQVVVDRLLAALIHGAAAVVFGAVLSTIFYTFFRGYHAFLHLNFFTQAMAHTEETAPLSQGGILHAIVGTLIEIGIATCVALPLGIGTAVFITEVSGRFARVVRTVVEAMTAMPDILAGLFIYAVLIVKFHVQFSGFAAAMALSVMMLPIIARSSEVVLRVVPGGLREASLALGASRWRTVWRVVLPTARSGLATALILGIARGIGETAPVLICSGEATYFNANPFVEPMNSLPLFVYQGYESGITEMVLRAWGAASVLLAIILILFVTARILARSRPGRS
ncbi:MAG TPA: phosphate ABC transporter permease PstA [Streptosporangiaceae bacterium]|nr:phosphate ABC transporter permease PstA [Streptosporangiaceae bacterium]